MSNISTITTILLTLVSGIISLNIGLSLIKYKEAIVYSIMFLLLSLFSIIMSMSTLYYGSEIDKYTDSLLKSGTSLYNSEFQVISSNNLNPYTDSYLILTGYIKIPSEDEEASDTISDKPVIVGILKGLEYNKNKIDIYSPSTE